MTLPKIGATAPQFATQTHTGEAVQLSDYKGQWVVLYFYPKAMTPGCTVQACGLRDAATAYKKAGITVLGLSPDPVKSLAKFVEKEGLTFTLLADPDHQICEKYGTWVEKSMYGKKYFGAARTTFIITPAGKIGHIIEKADPKTHADTVLAWVKNQA